MRATVGFLLCLANMASVVCTARATEASGTSMYYLRGYYKADSQRPVWQDSNDSPWYQERTDAPWVDNRLVKSGYVPFTHDSKNYYCLIDARPRTGSHVTEATFICGDPASVESLYIQNNSRPVIPITGGGPPLENSLRPGRPGGN
jgi:hypothetical protein